MVKKHYRTIILEIRQCEFHCFVRNEFCVYTIKFYTKTSLFISFLNQARASLRLARVWFLKIDPVRIVCMCVCECVCVCVCVCVCLCVSVPKAINN